MLLDEAVPKALWNEHTAVDETDNASYLSFQLDCASMSVIGSDRKDAAPNSVNDADYGDDDDNAYGHDCDDVDDDGVDDFEHEDGDDDIDGFDSTDANAPMPDTTSNIYEEYLNNQDWCMAWLQLYQLGLACWQPWVGVSKDKFRWLLDF